MNVVNVESGTDAMQFPEKEYINGIFLAVQVYLITNSLEVGRRKSAAMLIFFWIRLSNEKIRQSAVFPTL